VIAQALQETILAPGGPTDVSHPADAVNDKVDPVSGWANEGAPTPWEPVQRRPAEPGKEGAYGFLLSKHSRLLPNESRLSCGRNARRRKAVERQKQRLAGEATQFFPQGRPTASSAC
jgi:hypothetical protein